MYGPLSTIRNWSILAKEWDGYTAPELLPRYLTGQVYGHPDFLNGEYVCTSRIVKTDWENKVITTQNSEYHLEGPPNDEFVNWVKQNCPDLLKNIISSK